MGMGALMEITGTEGLMGKAQAEGARSWNLRVMMGLGLVVSWGTDSVWERGTDYVSLSMTTFLLIHRTQIYSYYVHVACTALSVGVLCVVPLVPMRGVCALHLHVPVHGTHDSLRIVSKSVHIAPSLTWRPAACSCGCEVPQGQHAVGTGTRQLPWLGTRSHRCSRSLGPGVWPLLGGGEAKR